MSTIQEIEQAIRKLTTAERAALMARLEDGWLPVQAESEGSPLAMGMAFPPPIVEPPAIQDPKERMAAFETWVKSHGDITAVADDSRESIYEGCGE